MKQHDTAEQAALAKLQRAIASTTSRPKEISPSLDSIRAECARKTIDKLEGAMTRTYKIAVFIRGDYDNREYDQGQHDALLKRAVDAFQEAEECADLGLKTIAGLHAEVVELERAKIVPAKQDVELMIKKNADTLRNTQDEISSTEEAIRNMRNSVDTQTEAVRVLRNKISETRDAKLVTDIIFSGLTLGIGNIINHGPPDPFHLQDHLDDALNLLNSSQQQLNEAGRNIWRLNGTRSSLEMRLHEQEQLKAHLPDVEHAAEDSKKYCVTLEQSFVKLKESSSKLLVKVREIEKGTSAMGTAFLKKDFAVGLLEICLDCLISDRVYHEAEMVKNEVIDEYGGEIPDEVAEMAFSFDRKIKDLGWTRVKDLSWTPRTIKSKHPLVGHPHNSDTLPTSNPEQSFNHNFINLRSKNIIKIPI
ncbi:NCU06412-like protein [Diplogelasinospora grovesii]|uniref:NCU06412-like protein n=1 Tax=Diplogelasinospora grovesii TaxID=303347 RepID=A0AAN6S3V5_9PEZI|nr:NCU06412-like protein [Diplogelasinospora grovesii]